MILCTLLITLWLLPCGVGRLIASQSQSALQSSKEQPQNRDRAINSVPHFYHTQVEFSARLKEMANSCKNILTLETIDAKFGIVVAVIKAKNSAKIQGSKKVAMLLFGEHAREIISSETALEFIADLCLLKSGSSEQSKRAEAVLQRFDVYVVPDANPSGRQQVLGGAMCTRSNANGVDLNRNWDHEWILSANDGEMYGGPKPFSEPETRALKTLMDRIKPYAFISVHSGAVGMYTPPGYTATPGSDTKALLNILTKVKEAAPCDCHMGMIGKELGYVSHGNCLDYAHDVVHTPFAFAVEIYEQTTEPSIDHGPCVSASDNTCAHKYYHTAYSSPRFRAASQQTVSVARLNTAAKCFAFFNPVAEADYQQTMATWSTKFMLMLCGSIDGGKC